MAKIKLIIGNYLDYLLFSNASFKFCSLVYDNNDNDTFLKCMKQFITFGTSFDKIWTTFGHVLDTR